MILFSNTKAFLQAQRGLKKSTPVFFGLFARYYTNREDGLRLSKPAWKYLQSSCYGRIHPRSPDFSVGLLVEDSCSGKKSIWSFLGDNRRFSDDSSPLTLRLSTLQDYSSYHSGTGSPYHYQAYDSQGLQYLGRKSLDLSWSTPLGNQQASLLIFDRVDCSIPEDFYQPSKTLPDHATTINYPKTLVAMDEGFLKIDLLNMIARRKMKRSRSQNRVMSGSALVAYKYFYERFQCNMPPLLRSVSLEILATEHSKGYNNPFYPEWCHRYGFIITPPDRDPQNIHNIAAGPRWLNSSMLLSEKFIHSLSSLCSRFYKNLPDVFMRSVFWTASPSAVIIEGALETQIVHKQNIFMTHQNFHITQPQLFSRAHDSAAIATVALDVLNDQPIRQHVLR